VKRAAALLGAALAAGCAAAPPARLTVADVEARVRAGRPVPDILHDIEASGSRFYLTVADVLLLREAGAHDALIDRMLQSAWRPETIYVHGRPWDDPWDSGIWWRPISRPRRGR